MYNLHVLDPFRGRVPVGMLECLFTFLMGRTSCRCLAIVFHLFFSFFEVAVGLSIIYCVFVFEFLQNLQNYLPILQSSLLNIFIIKAIKLYYRMLENGENKGESIYGTDITICQYLVTVLSP